MEQRSKAFRSLKVQVFLRRPHIFDPSSTYNLSISIKKYFSTLWLKLLSNFTKREDWPSFCGLLRIFELCYFCSVIEQIFQNVFYSGLVDHKKTSYFHLYEPSFSKKLTQIKNKLPKMSDHILNKFSKLRLFSIFLSGCLVCSSTTRC